MASNPIQNVDNLVANVVNQYIVRPTGGNATLGINGFVFDIVAEEEMRIESDITDHFVEDNYSIQDHWAQRPVRFSVHGYVAELADLFPNTLLDQLTVVRAQTLDAIGTYFPSFSAQATQIYAGISSVVRKATEVVNQAKTIYSLINGASTSSSKQQNAYQTFYQMWLSRQLCSVETPWGVINNMAIESLRPLQKDNTNLITDFEIIFKQINVVSTKIIPSLRVLNPAGTGQTLPVSPTIVPNQTPNQAPPPTQPKTEVNQINTVTNPVKGRLETMIPPEVPLGSTVGVPPPAVPKGTPPLVLPKPIGAPLPGPTIIVPPTLPPIMPPPYMPGILL